MVDGDTAFGEQLLDIAVGQAVPQVPADRDRDHVTGEPEPSRRTRQHIPMLHATSVQARDQTTQQSPHRYSRGIARNTVRRHVGRCRCFEICMPDLRTSWLAWRELGAVPTTNAAVGGCPRESIDHRFAIDGDDVRLSVVIPAHNEAVVIGACLRSLAAQDFASAFEVIVVDNGSTDETPVIAASLGARVIREQRLGVCWARQSGTLAARGQIVVSTDADTTFDAGWLSNINAKFGADPALVAVAGRCRFVEAPWWGTAYT